MQSEKNDLIFSVFDGEKEITEEVYKEDLSIVNYIQNNKKNRPGAPTPKR